MKEGFIKIHRKMLNWEWYNDKNTKELFLHLLLIANWKDSRFMGIEIKRGQTFTSLDRLSESLDMTRKSVRTSLTKLKRTHEVATEGHANGTLVTLIQYELYQTEGTPKGKQRAHEGAGFGHAEGTQGATIEELKKLQELKEVQEAMPQTHPLQVLISQDYPNVSKMKSQLTESQAETIQAKYKPEEIKSVLDGMENHATLTKKYTSVSLTIQGWLKRRQETGGNKQPIGAYIMPKDHF